MCIIISVYLVLKLVIVIFMVIFLGLGLSVRVSDILGWLLFFVFLESSYGWENFIILLVVVFICLLEFVLVIKFKCSILVLEG